MNISLSDTFRKKTFLNVFNYLIENRKLINILQLVNLFLWTAVETDSCSFNARFYILGEIQDGCCED